MKSSTDIYWNERASTIENDIEVNIMDIFQRNLEYDSILKYLRKDMRVLEVGCGNGISTMKFRDNVFYIDAFDFSKNMIDRAKKIVGETNNKFFVDNVLDIKNINGVYDAIICVRVLINLRNLIEQETAILNLVPFIKPDGIVIIVEGFKDGFNNLNQLRNKLKMPDLEPANINFYSSISDFKRVINKFLIIDEFHLGTYDFLTRVVYPYLIDNENVKHNTIFSEKSEQIARAINTDSFKELSRIKGYVLKLIDQ